MSFFKFEFLKSSTLDFTKLSSAPRLLSTHMPLHTLEEGLNKSPCKIVYLCRNVKEVLVSYWFFANSNTNGIERSSESENMNGVEDCAFEAMFESLCNGVTLCSPFWENVLSYWRGSLADHEHVFFIEFPRVESRASCSGQ